MLALSVLAACGGGVNETAATITYNAPYTGTATLTPISGSTAYTSSPATALAATLTMSQLSSTVTGNISVINPLTRDTVLAAGVTGHTTPDGLDLTIVQPIGCATRLSGPLTLGTDEALSGTLNGSDCHATGQDNLQLTLSLARQ